MTPNLEFVLGYTNIIANVVILFITLLSVVVYKLQKLEESKFLEQANRHLSSSVPQSSCRRFSFLEMQRATHNFHDDLIIGRGGFGKVYKGIIDFGASTVAIKRLNSTSRQGAREFRTEIEMLSKFRHSHLVSLIGFCDDSTEMILVYEYMPRGTLADHVHKKVRQGNTCLPRLSWVQRLKICIGAARGLDYLHTGTSTHHRVIHRDVKTTNILLDDNLAAKVSDFGLSKIGPANQEITYVSTNVRGTFGYFDPYYFSTQRLTRKSDVYSFGVVLFEVLCGRPAVDNSVDDEEQRGLAGWAQHCFKEGILDQIVDPSIKGKDEIFPDSLMAFVEVAVQCLQFVPKRRPTMAEVVVRLESALAVQEESTHYSLVEMPMKTFDNPENVDFSAYEVDNSNEFTRHNEENVDSSVYGVDDVDQNQGLSGNTSSEDGINGGNYQDERPPYRIKFIKKARKFVLLAARLISGLSNSRVPSVPVNVKPVTVKLRYFTLTELRRATRNFGDDMRFGRVFIGWVDEETYAPSTDGVGLAVAVKRFKGSLQLDEEWMKEKFFLEHYRNPRLVNLLGYCREKKEHLLVCEYMEKGSLDYHLFESLEPLGWNVRLKILIGVAQCLAFFNTAKQLIVYCVKTSHVLLDGEFNAKLSSGGLIMLFPPDNYTGFYAELSKDVFAFGVLLLEVLTGRPVIGTKISSSYYNDNHEISMIKLANELDPSLVDDIPESTLLSLASLIKNCLDLSSKTVTSMPHVLKALEQIVSSYDHV